MAVKLADGKSVIALDITLSRVQEIAEEIAQQTPGSYGIVLDETGQVIAHSDDVQLGKNYLEETGTFGAALADRLFRAGDRQFELDFKGQKYMVFAEKIGSDWLSVSLINTKVFYRPLMIIMSLLVLFTLLEAAVFVTVLYNQSAKNLAVASAEEAQSASRAKSRFLSRMSHEIRTRSTRSSAWTASPCATRAFPRARGRSSTRSAPAPGTCSPSSTTSWI